MNPFVVIGGLCIIAFVSIPLVLMGISDIGLWVYLIVSQILLFIVARIVYNIEFKNK
jgi:hypothetical protein